MSKFNKKTDNTTINLAGGKAFKHSSEMELVFGVLTTFLENKFYESGDERMNRIKQLIQLIDHKFTAKLAVYARKEFHLRSVSHFLVAELSKIHKGDSLIWKTIYNLAERPDDLTEICAILEGKLPEQVKKGCRRALLKFNRYQLSKYRMEGRAITLVDLFNMVHPKPKFANEEQKQAWSDLINGKLISTETWESQISSGKDKSKVWHDLISENKMGYMALLRNLRNIDQHASEEIKQKACELISNEKKVKKSKQLPFRFYNAYEQIENQKMLQAISKALDISMQNVPNFEGKTLIAVDGSGSMDGEPIKKASIFAASLFKSNDADLVIYDTSIQQTRLMTMDSTLTLSNQIQKCATGGGTETSLVFKYAYQEQKKYSRIIILSDNESWNEYSVQKVYNEYKKYNDCYVYAIDLQGYGTKDIVGHNVFHVYGFSEKIFDFMKNIEKGEKIIDIIKNYYDV